MRTPNCRANLTSFHSAVILWPYEQSMVGLLDLAKDLLFIVDTLNYLWECPGAYLSSHLFSFLTYKPNHLRKSRSNRGPTHRTYQRLSYAWHHPSSAEHIQLPDYPHQHILAVPLHYLFQLQAI